MLRSLNLSISDDSEDVICQDVCLLYMIVVAKENAEKKIALRNKICGYEAARSLASLWWIPTWLSKI